MILNDKELKSLIKNSAKINNFSFIKKTNPLIKVKHKEIMIKLQKVGLIYPFNIIYEFICYHFEIFDIEIDKEKFTEHYEEVSHIFNLDARKSTL